MQNWPIRPFRQWGMSDFQVQNDPSVPASEILRATYPAGSASPVVTDIYGAPVGGGQFFADFNLPPRDALHLRYQVRFPADFDFVQGGKLPGLFGGEHLDGGDIPDGTNGFSTRFMWRPGGAGEVYAYLPTSVTHGTSLGRGNWVFTPGLWHTIEQSVVLNTPGQADGIVRVWFDGNLVLTQSGLLFRTTSRLKIEGVLFSTFFGGDDPTWETPVTTYADFANFALWDGNPAAQKPSQAPAQPQAPADRQRMANGAVLAVTDTTSGLLTAAGDVGSQETSADRPLFQLRPTAATMTDGASGAVSAVAGRRGAPAEIFDSVNTVREHANGRRHPIDDLFMVAAFTEEL
jgi:hypothetical protein